MKRAFVLAALTLTVFLTFAPGVVLDPAAAHTPDAGVWDLDGWRIVSSRSADEGVASVVEPSGRVRVVTRGSGSIPPPLRAQGWVHIGDPGARDGYLFDAYQGRPGADSKMFLLTAPSGRSREYVHRLAPGEMINNSFVAIAPGLRWFVSGGWGTTRRLLVFSMPSLTKPWLGSAGVIRLSRPVRDVQGCSFARVGTLVCATNDPGTSLFPLPRQLLRIRLHHRLNGRSEDGEVGLLGTTPRPAGCFAASETEGLDIHATRLLLAVRSGCDGHTYLYRYTHTEPDHDED